MGIYDRDYIRRQAPPGRGVPGVARMRMWSANTWIIIACIAVFVVDDFLPAGWVPMRTEVTVPAEQLDGVDRSQLVAGEQVSVAQQDAYGRPFVGLRPIFAPVPSGRVQVARRIERRMHPIRAYLHFSTSRVLLRRDVFGKLVGFEFWRLLFNMIGLFFFGPMAERYLGSKRYLAFYLLCGMCGALLYMALNLGGYVTAGMFGKSVAIPGLLFNDPSTPLIGASAGVFGVIMAGAYLSPNTMVLLFFFLPMRLRTLAYLIVAMALFAVIFGSRNAGGEAGHLGGALAGFYFIRRPHHLHGFFDVLGRVDPTSHHYRHRRPRAGPLPERGEVDRILDKISAKGIHSLTEREKRLLREASEGK
ncbi:MAG: rhomboid family intramembrane serine protease [Planctomycetota bacterium]|jgi:membrane associated rhomboid family serine protease